MKKAKTTIDKKHIVKALVAAAKIREVVISIADKGLPTTSTILPIILPISIDDEVWEKLCWTTCIAIRPGARNSINGTQRTKPLLGPIANDITSKNRNAVTTGPKTVWPNTIKNLNVSFL